MRLPEGGRSGVQEETADDGLDADVDFFVGAVLVDRAAADAREEPRDDVRDDAAVLDVGLVPAAHHDDGRLLLLGRHHLAAAAALLGHAVLAFGAVSALLGGLPVLAFLGGLAVGTLLGRGLLLHHHLLILLHHHHLHRVVGGGGWGCHLGFVGSGSLQRLRLQLRNHVESERLGAQKAGGGALERTC